MKKKELDLSPDLTPLNLISWSYVKHRYFSKHPFAYVDHLERINTETVRRLTPAMVRSVRKNYSKNDRMDRKVGYIGGLLK